MGHERWHCSEVGGRPCWYEPMCAACFELCRRGDALALAPRWRHRFGDDARRKAAEYCENFGEVRQKRCLYDSALLPVSAFDRFAPSRDGYREYCRACAEIVRRERRARERLKVLAAYRKAARL